MADKYVEHDFVIIFVDMILHKKPVYRHLLFNRLPYRDLGIDVSVFTISFSLLWVVSKERGDMCIDIVC